MSENYPSLEKLKELYDRALKFKEIECWKWMTDDYIFGVQNPETGEIGYCCVIGNLGEALGLIIYKGSRGLDGYLKIRYGGQKNYLDVFFQQEGFSITFEDRKFLRKEDLQVIKELGLKLRGRNAYPLFRRLKPGYHPWFIIQEEASFLIIILQQAADVCLRFKDDKTLLIPPAKSQYLIRVPHIREGELLWKDKWMEPDPLKSDDFASVEMDELRMQRIKSSAVQGKAIWEFDYFYTDIPVKGEGRPYFPKTLLIVDNASGLILHAHISTPSKYQREFTDSFISFVEKMRVLPEEILVVKDEALKILEPVTSRLKVKLTKVKRCKEIEKAQNSFSRFISQR